MFVVQEVGLAIIELRREQEALPAEPWYSERMPWRRAIRAMGRALIRLFIQPGEQPSVVREDLGKEMCELYRGAGIFAAEKPVIDTVNRIERLRPQWVHPMHGGSLPAETLRAYTAALRSHPFAYDGRLFGRMLPT